MHVIKATVLWENFRKPHDACNRLPDLYARILNISRRCDVVWSTRSCDLTQLGCNYRSMRSDLLATLHAICRQTFSLYLFWVTNRSFWSRVGKDWRRASPFLIICSTWVSWKFSAETNGLYLYFPVTSFYEEISLGKVELVSGKYRYICLTGDQ